MKQLSCRICGRREVWGILSSSAWARTDEGEGRVCPTCVSKHDDWRERAAADSSVGD